MGDLTDVAIIGGGPAGLAAATVLKQVGISRVVVIEREADAGGIPRHCGHHPFGLREFKRVLRGPDYAARLVARALMAGVEIRTLTTVVEASKGGVLKLATPAGLGEIRAKRVIYATGVRETPRAGRLISGVRTQGVLNTGALQNMVYLKGRKPFEKPVIIGTELVAFSAISTCRHAGIRPVAMIEAGKRPTARWPIGLFPRLNRIPLHLNTRLDRILGGDNVTGVLVTGPNGATREIACDGVILTGKFTPDATLARTGHLAVDPATGGPVVDPWGRCSDPVYFATGNLLRPVETAGWSWAEGCKTGAMVAADLAGELPIAADYCPVVAKSALIKYVMPQRVGPAAATLQLRVTKPVKGRIIVRQGKQVILQQKINTLPERRILVSLPVLVGPGAVHIDIE